VADDYESVPIEKIVSKPGHHEWACWPFRVKVFKLSCDGRGIWDRRGTWKYESSCDLNTSGPMAHEWSDLGGRWSYHWFRRRALEFLRRMRKTHWNVIKEAADLGYRCSP
jgi:hypothetical protein